jgi:hypothetical protein
MCVILYMVPGVQAYRFRAPVEYIVLEGDGAVDVDRLLLQVCGTGQCDLGLTRTWIVNRKRIQCIANLKGFCSFIDV